MQTFLETQCFSPMPNILHLFRHGNQKPLKLGEGLQNFSTQCNCFVGDQPIGSVNPDIDCAKQPKGCLCVNPGKAKREIAFSPSSSIFFLFLLTYFSAFVFLNPLQNNWVNWSAAQCLRNYIGGFTPRIIFVRRPARNGRVSATTKLKTEISIASLEVNIEKIWNWETIRFCLTGFSNC